MRTAAPLLAAFVAVGFLSTPIAPLAAQDEQKPVTTHPQEAIVRPHAEYALAFPKTVGRFTRTGVTRYNADGTDISAGYHTDRATATVYPAPQTPAGKPDLERALKEIRYEIETLHPKAKAPVITPDTLTQNGRSVKGIKMTYQLSDKFSGAVRPVVFLVRLFPQDRWLIYYRFTYFAVPKAVSEADIAKFCTALTWPKTLEKGE